MISRINYTDRKKILRKFIHFILNEQDGIPSWDANFLAEEYHQFGEDTEVIIEAYDGPVVMRFNCGPITRFELPDDKTLHRFRPGQRVLFRIKIVDLSDDRRPLLAWANKIQPMLPEEVAAGFRSIFPVSLEDLGEELWKVSWNDNTPHLALNEKVDEPDLRQVVYTDPNFITLVFPSAIRTVLTELLFGDLAPPETEPGETGGEPEHDWINFAANQLGAGPKPNISPEKGETVIAGKEWIDRAVRNFAHTHSLRAAFIQSRLGE